MQRRVRDGRSDGVLMLYLPYGGMIGMCVCVYKRDTERESEREEVDKVTDVHRRDESQISSVKPHIQARHYSQKSMW